MWKDKMYLHPPPTEKRGAISLLLLVGDTSYYFYYNQCVENIHCKPWPVIKLKCSLLKEDILLIYWFWDHKVRDQLLYSDFKKIMTYYLFLNPFFSQIFSAQHLLNFLSDRIQDYFTVYMCCHKLRTTLNINMPGDVWILSL